MRNRVQKPDPASKRGLKRVISDTPVDQEEQNASGFVEHKETITDVATEVVSDSDQEEMDQSSSNMTKAVISRRNFSAMATHSCH